MKGGGREREGGGREREGEGGRGREREGEGSTADTAGIVNSLHINVREMKKKEASTYIK